MGTRGTLHVYLDGELKVRQYNQWDSYPQGQFGTICDFFKSEDNVEKLTEVLKQTDFYAKQEIDAVRAYLRDGTMPDWMKDDEYDMQSLATRVNYLINRDYGARILWQIVALNPTHLFESPFHAHGVRYFLPDWDTVFEEGITDEEGNYVIHITTSPIENGENGDYNISFKLSGEWHGVYHEFPQDYIPTDEELEKWEEEAHREGW